MKPANTVKTWTATKTQHLYRHKSGRYYARLFADGKERWKSLETSVYEVARQKLNGLRSEAQKLVKVKPARLGRMTMADAIAAFDQEIESGRRMRNRTKAKTPNRESTKFYRRQTIDALKRSWSEIIGEDFAETEVRKISEEKAVRWSEAYQLKVSAARYNNTMGTLRRLFDIAIEAGELHANPAAGLQRVSPEPKQVVLPSPEDFRKFVAAIRSAKSRMAGDRADFVEILAYTGARKNEAANLTWADVDFAGGWITLRVTKNGKPREVPMIEDARRLLERIRSERPNDGAGDSVLLVDHARECMNAAARKLKVPQLTHHDLRSLFATLAIESGAPIPTVAEILGHQDGGKLLLDTYNRTRRDFKKAAVSGLKFGVHSEGA